MEKITAEDFKIIVRDGLLVRALVICDDADSRHTNIHLYTGHHWHDEFVLGSVNYSRGNKLRLLREPIRTGTITTADLKETVDHWEAIIPPWAPFNKVACCFMEKGISHWHDMVSFHPFLYAEYLRLQGELNHHNWIGMSHDEKLIDLFHDRLRAFILRQERQLANAMKAMKDITSFTF